MAEIMFQGKATFEEFLSRAIRAIESFETALVIAHFGSRVFVVVDAERVLAFEPDQAKSIARSLLDCAGRCFDG